MIHSSKNWQRYIVSYWLTRHLPTLTDCRHSGMNMIMATSNANIQLALCSARPMRHASHPIRISRLQLNDATQMPVTPTHALSWVHVNHVSG